MLGKLLQARLDGNRMVLGFDSRFLLLACNLDEASPLAGADALDPAARQHPLVRHVEEAGLEAGAAQVGHENLHDYFKNVSRTLSSGRGMTWALASSPFWLAALEPASPAARTGPTAPPTRVGT